MMGPGPARIVASADGNRQGGAFAVPAAGWRGRAGMFVLTAAAGLALASGAMIGTPAAHAAAAAHANTRFDPCPCDNPVCRSLCFQSMASGGPASMIHRQTPLAAARAVVRITATAVNCPPPSTAITASSDGNPGC